jgi:3-phenylpropionate/trans-cinnamate dioxygenase ferredoxin reductase subunit
MRHVIVGAGPAGLRAAEAIRAVGDEGEILLVGAEQEPPYSRPPLSKEYLLGSMPSSELFLQPPTFYADRRIELRLGVRAIALDVKARRLELSTGERLAFDRLLIASGSEPRRLAVKGAELEGLYTLRTLWDATALASALRAASRVVVLGAGLIGLEVAAAARQAGKEVVVVESAPTALTRILGSHGGAPILELHRDQGVRVLTAMSVTALRGHRRVEEVELTSGERLAADLVVVGVGIQPATGWLVGSGLELGNGIHVDARAETSVPGIFAAGDVANAWNPLLGARLRLEQHGNALAQGTTAGRAMAGRPEPYAAVPAMGSTQYGRRIQFVGHLRGDEELLTRGRIEERTFTLLFLRGNRLAGAFALHRPRDILTLRPLITRELPLRREQLADPSMDLQHLIQQHEKARASA